MTYQTERRNNNRGHMNLIIWQKAMQLFQLVRSISFVQSKTDFKLRSQTADAAQSVCRSVELF